MDSSAFLVNTGAEKDAKAISAWIPLHCASIRGHFEIVKFLVDSRADKEAKNKSAWTSLHFAAEKGHLEIVKFLVESGADKVFWFEILSIINVIYKDELRLKK